MLVAKPYGKHHGFCAPKQSPHSEGIIGAGSGQLPTLSRCRSPVSHLTQPLSPTGSGFSQLPISTGLPVPPVPPVPPTPPALAFVVLEPPQLAV
jgi:hypothetical protein